jgi:transglutaminase-like putative cysteine protease
MRSAPSSFLSSSSPIPSSLTIQEEGIHPLLKAVRTTYRAQYRKPQFEPICVQWIERFLRAYPNLPVGRLGTPHVQSFLAELADQGTAPAARAQAREALHFLQTEVLRAL